MASQAQTVGEKLVQLCNQGKNTEAMKLLYREDIVSTEAGTIPGVLLP